MIRRERLSFYRSTTGWRWRLRGRNGRIIAASSEGFVRERDAKANAWKTRWGLETALGKLRAMRRPS